MNRIDPTFQPRAFDALIGKCLKPDCRWPGVESILLSGCGDSGANGGPARAVTPRTRVSTPPGSRLRSSIGVRPKLTAPLTTAALGTLTPEIKHPRSFCLETSPIFRTASQVTHHFRSLWYLGPHGHQTQCSQIPHRARTCVPPLPCLPPHVNGSLKSLDQDPKCRARRKL